MYKNKKILAVTLARGGSKEIENKNIVKIKNKPLIYYTIREAKKSKFIDRYIISTDSKKIKKICKTLKADCPFLRPKKLSTSTAKAVDADKHALNWIEKNENQQYDIFVELMATNPFKTSKDIDLAIKKIIDKKADSVIGMSRLQDHHPMRIKKIKNGKIENFNKLLKEIPEQHRQQLRPKAYIRNGSIYVVKSSLLRKGIRYGTKKSYPLIMSSKKSINIDTKLDLYLAKKILNEKNS
jgi:CMP-N,N'-diacetyllegionaminic acid synthase